jgi:hypothetical protein
MVGAHAAFEQRERRERGHPVAIAHRLERPAPVAVLALQQTLDPAIDRRFDPRLERVEGRETLGLRFLLVLAAPGDRRPPVDACSLEELLHRALVERTVVDRDLGEQRVDPRAPVRRVAARRAAPDLQHVLFGVEDLRR